MAITVHSNIIMMKQPGNLGVGDAGTPNVLGLTSVAAYAQAKYGFTTNGAVARYMDPISFEQIYVPKMLFGEGTKFLKENMEVKIGIESEIPIYAEPPTFVEVEITHTEPGVKGNTATNAMKPATVETGATVNVPLFVNQGDKIRIDTRTSEYVERVK